MERWFFSILSDQMWNFLTPLCYKVVGEDCTGTVSAHADFVFFFFFFGEKCEKKVVLIRAQCSVL